MKKLKLFSLALMAMFATSVWADTYTVNCETTSSSSPFNVTTSISQYEYSSNENIAGWKLINFSKDAAITITNVTGATITAITAEGVAANNGNKTVNYTVSDGTTSATTSSGSWNNRGSSSMTSKALNASNVAKLKCDAGQTYTMTNSDYAAGTRFVITYTSTLPTSLTNGESTETSHAVSWTAPSTAPANGYLVAYSTSSTAPGNSVTSTSGNYTVAEIAKGTTNTTLSTLAPGTTYYWWVRSKNARGNSSWVAGESFTTEGSCVAVDAPADLAEATASRTTSAITFTWTAATNASSYDVKLWDNASCTGDPIASGNVTTTSKEFTDLADGTTYYCKVQSKGDGSTYCIEGGITSAVSGTTAAIPTHTVTAATSTGTTTYGNVSAEASSIKEGATTTITAVPASGYRVKSWAVSGAGASIDPSGESSSTTTTLTMGTANATVTVTFEAIPSHKITYTNTKGADNSANPTTYYEGTGVASFTKLRHVVGYDFTGWNPNKINSSATTDQTIEAQWNEKAATTGDASLTYALAFASNSVTTSSITRVNGALYDATDLSLAHTSFAGSTSTSKGCSSKITTTNEKDNNNYIEVTFKIADGYTFTPTEVKVQGIAVSNNKTIEVELKDNQATPVSKSVSGTLTAVSDPTSGGYTVTLDFDESGTIALKGTVTAKIFAYGKNDHWRIGTPFVISGTIAAIDYAVTFAAGDGSGEMDPLVKHVGDEVTLPACTFTAPTGYAFNEWTSTDVTISAGKFTMPASDVTITATYSLVDYDVTYTAPTNGSYTIKVGDADAVSANTTANYNQTITLTVAPTSGYVVDAVKYNDGADHVLVGAENVYSFTMPNKAVTVSATFKAEGGGTDLDNTAEEVKAVKRIENGMLIIEKNGVRYNVTGQVIK